MEVRNSIFTVRNVMKVLTALCFTFVFCPSFFVSCGEYTYKYSVFELMSKGIPDVQVAPNAKLVVFLILPIIIFVVLFIKEIKDKELAAVVTGGSAINAILLLVYKIEIGKNIQEANAGMRGTLSYSMTFWWWLNVIFVVIIAALSIAVLCDKLTVDTDLAIVVSGGNTQGALNQMSSKMTQMANSVSNIANNMGSNNASGMGYCHKCGAPLVQGSVFCAKCGTPVQVAQPQTNSMPATPNVDVPLPGQPKPEIPSVPVTKEEEVAIPVIPNVEPKPEKPPVPVVEEQPVPMPEPVVIQPELDDGEVTQRVDIVQEQEETVVEEFDEDATQVVTDFVKPQEEASIFCFNCGTKLPADAVFCDHCGTRIKE